MRKFIIILLCLAIVGCTTGNINKEDYSLIDIASGFQSDSDLTLLGLKISSVFALKHGYQLNTPYLYKDMELAKKEALNVLNNYWKINSKEELLETFNSLYLEGIKKEYINTLEAISRRTDLVSDSEKLLVKENWGDEEVYYGSLHYITEYGEYITYKDLYYTDLARISYLVRMGVSCGYLNRKEANIINSYLGLHFLNFKGGWYEFGRHIAAGTGYLYKGSDSFRYYLRNSVVSAFELIEKDFWDMDDWGILKSYEKKVVIPYPDKIPSAPKDSDKRVKLVFDQERDSTNLMEIYKPEYLLYASVRNNDFLSVRELLKGENSYYDYSNPSGLGIVHEAVGKDIRILEYLLNIGFSPNIKSYREGSTSLHQAIKDKEYDDALLIIKYKGDVNIEDYRGMTPLSYGVKSNDIRAIELLMENGADGDIGYIGSYTLAAHAIRNNNKDAFYQLIDSVDNINSPAGGDWTLLHLAARYSEPDIIRNLLLRGADPNALTEAGYTAMDLAAFSETDNVFEKFRELVNGGGDINRVNHKDKTPLMNYLGNRNKPHDEKLKRSGILDPKGILNIYPDFKEIFQLTSENLHIAENGKNLLNYICFFGSAEDINLVLDSYKGDIYTGEYGFKVAVILLRRGLSNEFKKFIEQWQDWDQRHHGGWNIAGSAILWGALDDAKYIIEYGLDINTPNFNNVHLLTYMAEKKAYDLILWSFENYGSMINIQNADDLYKRVAVDSLKGDDKAKEIISYLDKYGIKYDSKQAFFGNENSFWVFEDKENIAVSTSEDLFIVKNTDENVGKSPNYYDSIDFESGPIEISFSVSEPGNSFFILLQYFTASDSVNVPISPYANVTSDSGIEPVYMNYDYYEKEISDVDFKILIENNRIKFFGSTLISEYEFKVDNDLFCQLIFLPNTVTKIKKFDVRRK